MPNLSLLAARVVNWQWSAEPHHMQVGSTLEK